MGAKRKLALMLAIFSLFTAFPMYLMKDFVMAIIYTLGFAIFISVAIFGK